MVLDPVFGVLKQDVILSAKLAVISTPKNDHGKCRSLAYDSVTGSRPVRCGDLALL